MSIEASSLWQAAKVQPDSVNEPATFREDGNCKYEIVFGPVLRHTQKPRGEIEVTPRLEPPASLTHGHSLTRNCFINWIKDSFLSARLFWRQSLQPQSAHLLTVWYLQVIPLSNFLKNASLVIYVHPLLHKLKSNVFPQLRRQLNRTFSIHLRDKGFASEVHESQHNLIAHEIFEDQNSYVESTYSNVGTQFAATSPSKQVYQQYRPFHQKNR